MYLKSDLPVLDEASLTVIIFFNVKLEVTTEYGTSITNRLCVVQISSTQDSMDTSVIFQRIEDRHNDNLLENVNDALMLVDWKGDNDSEFTALLFMPDKKNNNVVFVEINPKQSAPFLNVQLLLQNQKLVDCC